MDSMDPLLPDPLLPDPLLPDPLLPDPFRKQRNVGIGVFLHILAPISFLVFFSRLYKKINLAMCKFPWVNV